MKNKQIDYYGTKDNYIHLKFGDARKMCNFTSEFTREYKLFTEEFLKYFNNEPSQFSNVFQVVNYVYNNEIPVHFYFNFTDEPAESREDIITYLLKENNTKHLHE